jgi:hypothetical protein
MKRLFGLKKKKIKVGGDNDDDNDNNYAPPPAGKNNNYNDDGGSSSAYNFQQVVNEEFPNVGTTPHTSNTTKNRRSRTPSSSSGGGAHQQNNHNSSNADNNSDVIIGAGYRYALTAYNDTINPILSNEDGMGGGGGTLRSRLRGSGGSKHRSLIPSFEPNSVSLPKKKDNASSSSNNNHDNAVRMRTPQHSYLQGSRNHNNDNNGREGWSPIPEEPKSASPPADKRAKKSSDRMVSFIDEGIGGGDNDEDGQSPTSSSSGQQQGISQSSSARSTHISRQHSSSSSQQQQFSSSSSTNNNFKKQYGIILQPDAIYEEHYGDAYIDQLPKYLYPSGYQSMRPRSGPWKLSIFIFGLFLWLSVFIVGHCYDRGKQYYYNANDNDGNDNNNNNNNGGDGDDNNNNAVDDAYLAEVDDDAVLMETRWCGSKLLHFMWMISVAITVLAMSYCSIIGYVKVRDVVVAAGRSQPAGTFGMGNNGGGSGGEDGKSGGGGGNGGWRSDYYSKVDNVSGNSGAGERSRRNGNDEESGGGSNDNNDQYSSYQAGGDGNRRYVPSIYQSDGMPQFLGGHIYRPTQAAITMTNRP